MPTITFSGLATGVNTGALIDELVGLQRRPITVLESQKAKYQQKLTLFQDLSSKLGALKTAATELSTASSFFVRKATSSNETVLVATAGSNAELGNHTVTVNALARVTTQASAGFSSTTSNIRQGTLSITVGTSTTNITVDATNNTLEGLRDAINGSAAEVTATIVQENATSYRLVVTGDKTGAANAVSIDESGLTIGADPLPGFTVTQAAQDASLTVDGLAITRSTNTVSDVITGVTLSLKSSSASQIQVTVDNDVEAIKEQITEFIEAYNDVMLFIHEQTKYDSANKTAAPLIGDSTLSTLQTSLRTVLGKQVSGTPSSLAEIGITSSTTDGTLAVDDTKLTNNLNTSLTQVSNIFLDATNGVAQGMITTLDNATRSTDGILTARIDGTQDTIDKLEDQIASKEASLELFEDELVRKFAALEALISQLQTQQQFLNQQILSLPKIT